MFGIVDCNNFYASCERLFRPDLEGKPIVVLSNNDGCVIARSEEAKAAGIKMGVPTHEIWELAEQHDVEVFSSNYELYGDMSRRVMSILGSFAPLEIYSIDEAFLDLSHIPADSLDTYARQIKETVERGTGIPVTIGVAPTKTLAKVAGKRAKKLPSAAHVLVLQNQQQTNEALAATPIEDIWGIGRRLERVLQPLQTGLDLKNASKGFIRKQLRSVVGYRTWLELNGYPCIGLEEAPAGKQHICTSRSFGQRLTQLPDIESAVAYYTAQCAAKLRKQRSAAGTITVFIMTGSYSSDSEYYNSLTLPLPVASNSTLELVHYANFALKKIFKPGFRYKKAGVIVGEVVPESQVQSGLFDEVNRSKHALLMQSLDKLNGRFGREMVKPGLQGTGTNWKLKCEKRSPCYTTRISDILTIAI